MCLGVCVSVSLKLYAGPPCAWNTAGFRSKSLERGLNANEFPVNPWVTHGYAPRRLRLLVRVRAQTHPLRCPCQASCLITNAFLSTLLPRCPHVTLRQSNIQRCSNSLVSPSNAADTSLVAIIVICLFRDVPAVPASGLFVLLFLFCCRHLILIV